MRNSLIVAVLCCLSALVHAEVPSLTGWPPPGGVSYSGSGSPITSGGLTWSYSGFDSSAYGDLYYTLSQPVLSYRGSYGDTLSYNAGASGLAAGTAVWSGWTQVLDTSGIWRTFETRAVLTITDFSGNALSLIEAGHVGLPSTVGALLDVNGSFKANWQFLARSSQGGSWQAAGFLYDTTSKLYSNQLSSSIGSAWYATAPVPEPEVYGMLCVGLLMIGRIARRRRS